MKHAPKSIDISDLIASLPEIVEDLAAGTTPGVDVTKEGRVVALLRPPHASLHGSLRGSVQLPSDLDLTKPVFEDEIHAEHGRIHE